MLLMRCTQDSEGIILQQCPSSLDLIINGLFIFKNLLDNAFNMTVITLILLSVLLIYSLMQSNVEEKTYEFGMLRALGIRQKSLITLLALQSTFFTVPGLILGMVLAYCINVLFSYHIFNFTSIPSGFNLRPQAVTIGICIAVFVPLLSNIIPIRRALTKTLKDSLDIYHRVVSDVSVRIIKLAELGISPAQTVGALTLVILGFITYDVAPYAFVFQNLTLFFLIMTMILMLLIIGFTLILNLVQGMAERGVLKMIMLLYPQDRNLKSVILKNLSAHRRRNNKTSLMFSIALSFLVFSGTAFRLNSSLIVDQLKAGLGADLVIKSLRFEKSSLKEEEIRNTLMDYMQIHENVIKDYAFVSKPLTWQAEMPRGYLSPLSGSPYVQVEVLGVDQSYLRASYEDFYLPKEYDKSITYDTLKDSGKRDGIQGLYKDDGLTTISSYDEYSITANAAYRQTADLNSFFGEKEVRIIVSSGIALFVSAEVGTPTLLEFGDTKFRARVRNTAAKFPGFFFTGYRMMFKSMILTSHQDFKYITDKVNENLSRGQVAKGKIEREQAGLPPGLSEGVPKHGLIIKLQPGVDRGGRNKIELV